MSSDTATSVCKGCFAFKGNVRRAKEKDYLPTMKDKFVVNRLQLYKEVWDELHLHIDMLRSDLNSKIFDDLISFTAQCHKDRDGKDWALKAIGEIPTAVLITGVNTPDHGIMFSNLDSMLKSRVTPLVVRILTRDCTRLSSLIFSLVTQLTRPNAPQDEEHEDGEIFQNRGDDVLEGTATPVQLKVPLKNRRAITMSTLVKWYDKKYSECKQPISVSPRKKLKIDGLNGVDSSEDKTDQKSKKKPLIVVMLEDAENICPSVLQDFISLCSTHLTSLPIVLVMGIATAVTAIHQILPSSVSSLLCMQKYQAPPASQYLTQLLDKIVMAPELPFKLGPKVFHFLLDIFLCHDFSIMNFTMGFQHCMMEHYLYNPLSLLCCMEGDISSKTSHLTHAHLEDIRRQPAFQRYVEEHVVGPDQAKLLTDDSFSRAHLAAALRNLHQYHTKMFAGLHFLHHLGLTLPKFPLGKHFRELYSICLTGIHICDSKGYKESLQLLRMMSLDDLCPLLEGGLDKIAKWKDSSEEMVKLVTDVQGFIHRLKNVEDEPDEELQDQEGDEKGRILPQRAKLHELKERLQSLSRARYKSPYERLRDEIVGCLHSHFQTLLGSPLLQPLHEILYFSNLGAVKEQLMAVPRSSTQQALVQPGKYLNCACCQCDPDSILPTMPDLCIVYKLHLECGTLVNLYDWLLAFVTIVSADKESDQRKSKKNSKLSQKNPSVELRARFIRAVSELQFLGFIKSTRRKTDHVMRLTW